MTCKISLDTDQHVTTITLCRPQKLNAIDPDMLEGLSEVLDQLEQDRQVRAVIITGEGDRAFSAGADIKAWAALPPLEMWQRWIPAGHRILKRLTQLPQPVIAAINGIAFGGGLELALACDLRISTDTAAFAMPEVSIATVPGWGGTFRLPEIIGKARSKALILTGERIDAHRALHWGLITDMVPAPELLQRVRAIANRIAANAPLAVQMAKQLIDQHHAREHMEALAGALGAYTKDGQEGVMSFQQKREPDYKGT